MFLMPQPTAGHDPQLVTSTLPLVALFYYTTIVCVALLVTAFHTVSPAKILKQFFDRVTNYVSSSRNLVDIRGTVVQFIVTYLNCPLNSSVPGPYVFLSCLLLDSCIRGSSLKVITSHYYN